MQRRQKPAQRFGTLFTGKRERAAGSNEWKMAIEEEKKFVRFRFTTGRKKGRLFLQLLAGRFSGCDDVVDSRTIGVMCNLSHFNGQFICVGAWVSVTRPAVDP